MEIRREEGGGEVRRGEVGGRSLYAAGGVACTASGCGTVWKTGGG